MEALRLYNKVVCHGAGGRLVPENRLPVQENEREDLAMREIDMLKKQEETFWNSPLDAEEQWMEVHSDEFVPCENQTEVRRQMMTAAARPAAVRYSSDAGKGRKPVTLRVDVADMEVIKQIARE